MRSIEALPLTIAMIGPKLGGFWEGDWMYLCSFWVLFGFGAFCFGGAFLCISGIGNLGLSMVSRDGALNGIGFTRLMVSSGDFGL